MKKVHEALLNIYCLSSIDKNLLTMTINYGAK